MQTSAGIIITDGHQFLIGHVSFQNWWDIPKGRLELGEMPRDAAIRETYEETGLEINPDDLLDLGMFYYLPKKRLHLFLLIAPDLPPIEKMQCTTLYNPIKRTDFLLPEMDRWVYIPFSKKKKFLIRAMADVIGKVEENDLFPYIR